MPKTDIGNRADKTLNKEYKKSKMKITKFVALGGICWRTYNGSYSTKMSTYITVVDLNAEQLAWNDEDLDNIPMNGTG
jgi:hypothetical protein